MAKIIGEKALKKFLDKVGTDTRNKIRRAVVAGGNAVQKKARENLASNKTNDTGNLTNSIISTKTLGKDEFITEIGPTVDYGAHVEFGTRPHFPPTLPLKRWAERHGFSNPVFAAEMIALKISHRGTRAQPYLIPAFNVVSPKVFKKIDSIVKGIR